jgi:hypothetical protein
VSQGLTRRDFVAAVLAAAGCLPLRRAAAGTDPAGVRSRLFRNRVVDVAHILRYTGPYLAKHPGEGDVDPLARLVFGGEAAGGAEAMKRAARVRIRGDFEEGRLENLDGWLLSVTEVRLWCLYVLVST